MHFQIREIILWPRSPELPPSRVAFAADALNVVTGVSRTGKSAVIPIIDYCLGSDTCQIPVNTIRDRCSWFGIVVDTERGQMLLARREPGSQRTTSDMYVLDAPTVEPPPAITSKNATVDSVKRMLDGLAGLTQLDFDADETGSGFKGRPELPGPDGLHVSTSEHRRQSERSLLQGRYTRASGEVAHHLSVRAGCRISGSTSETT
jgi:hypothetical protein